MTNFFTYIFDFFRKRHLLFYLILIIPILIMGILVSKIKFTEDITSFFPEDKQNTSLIFNNLKIKDKIIFIVNTPKDSLDKSYNVYSAIDIADGFINKLQENISIDDYAVLTPFIDDEIVDKVSDYIYNNLPVFLNDQDYKALDSLTSKESIQGLMDVNYNYIVSNAGSFVSNFIYKDPLRISSNLFLGLEGMNSGGNYTTIDSYIFSNDNSALLMFAQLKDGADCAPFINAIEETIKNGYNSVEYFGAPAVAYYNATQIKKDTLITLNIAILVVIILITLAFKNKRNIILIIFPALYGGLFALSIIYLVKGEISSIAAGAGSVIFGIALSYSIHFISHANHCRSVKDIINELSEPLTIGSFTTIGGFAGLLFTNSPLLQDFGLFASLSLIGTTLFTLIFLPHFIKISNYSKENKFLRIIESFTSYRWEKNKALIIILVILTIVCAFFYNKVEFNGDMMALNYEPLHLQRSREKLEKISNQKDNEYKGYFIAYSKNLSSSANSYQRLCMVLDSLENCGLVSNYSSIKDYVIGQDEQNERLKKWQNFWTNSKKEEVIGYIEQASIKNGFKPNTFSPFQDLLHKNYTPNNYMDTLSMGVFQEWINEWDASPLFICQATINKDKKEDVYKNIEQIPHIIIADRSYYASIMATSVNEDFYLILYICSFLIFFALLISYGRIELTLISFLPMFLSWVIILGLMAIFKIEFNIVNIILSTFIFGIGDDFSIFIMDGLLIEYKRGKRLLNSHKTAIFFSAFAILTGMGSLLFAEHPAIKSLAFISIFGIITVVLVSYSVQPIIFNLLITKQTKKSGFPYTLASFLNTFYAFNLFIFGCSLIQGYILTLFLIPIKKDIRQRWVHKFVQILLRWFLKVMITVKCKTINDANETFKNPSVIIANHQSFIDILVMLALHPKLLMVTNNWVWNSPFFGRIVRYLGFYNTINGFENLAECVKPKIEAGYSIIVFPEGTRSADCTIKRFHKGAFYLAQLLNLDILPVVLYGNGMISSKKQPFYIKKGIIIAKILPRIQNSNTLYGKDYSKRCKAINTYFREEYNNLCQEYNAPFNKYFYDALIKNYIYKGPVLEWYMRVKVKMEKNYAIFNSLVPYNANIVDIGCGYGPLSLMLSLYSKERKILGLDYDSNKIDTANHLFSKTDNLKFEVADIREKVLPNADVYILNDVLHYVDCTTQKSVIEQCIAKLNNEGKIIIRDGDTNKSKHKNTETTEVLSTKLFKFNKTDGALQFFSSNLINDIALKHNMTVKTIMNDNLTSNTIYILSYGK